MPRVRQVLRWAFAVMSGLAAMLSLIGNVRLYHSEQSHSDVVAQLRFLRAELDAGSAYKMQEVFPEGHLFSYLLYGLTWADIADSSPDLRAEGLREMRWALAHADSDVGRAPFSSGQVPAYGMFYRGWVARLRGEIVDSAGPDAPEVREFAADCAAIAEALRVKGPFPESYPGEAWPVDTVVAVSALRLHDEVLAPQYGPAITSWLTQARRQVDPRTGLLPHRALPVVEGARGSSQSIIQRFLPEIDPRFAASQYQRFRTQFTDTPLGIPGIREYPLGASGEGDVDSGPLILGVSASATVVAIGAARAHGDDGLSGPLTELGESLGMPIALGGQKRYALGMLPIGDAFLAWSAATPSATSDGERLAPVVSWWWRLPWHGVTLALIVLTVLIVRRNLRARRPPEERSTRVGSGVPPGNEPDLIPIARDL